MNKKIAVGITLLALSGLTGLNFYLPNVGNAFDVWRVWFTVVAFSVSWVVLITGIFEYTDF